MNAEREGYKDTIEDRTAPNRYQRHCGCERHGQWIEGREKALAKIGKCPECGGKGDQNGGACGTCGVSRQ